MPASPQQPLRVSLPFCIIGGSVIAQKKGETDLEIEQAKKAILIMGGRLGEIIDIDLEEFNDQRQLIIIDKICETPHQYPRRSGIPAKRPLL